MSQYDPKKIEAKWQERWLKEKIFKAGDSSRKPKYYQLETFPYPSAAGLHMGHPKGYTAEDVHARFARMGGLDGRQREVLYTIGWDAFGLPTENYAIKVGKTPKEVARENVANFTRQVRSLGFSYDWDRELNTSEPDYYKWTQWLFIQLWKKGLAYRAQAKVNWCPKDQTVLANEQVVDGHCERCGSVIEERDMEQWFVGITKYADRLLEDLKGLDWPAATIKRQEDWIGRSEGAEIDFPIKADFNYVVLHGFKGSPKDEQYKWIEREVEARGYRISVPELPHSETPSEVEQVEYVLKNVKFDEKTVILGKSLGAVVALKVVERLPHKIAGIVLAGGFLGTDGLYKKNYPYEKTFTWDFDFEKIKSKTGFIKILSDIGDDYAVLPSEGKKIRAVLGGELIETKARKPHFGDTPEPVLLNALLPQVTVFTTRPDTLFGATYLVLAPEHPLVAALLPQLANAKEVEKYIKETSHKTDRMRQETAAEKTGVELRGVKALNPATNEEIPIYAADYVLGGYGTGAIMAVPAHDERDFEFAQKFKLPIKQVVAFSGDDPNNPPKPGIKTVPRKSIIAALVNSKKKECLVLDWPEFGWRTFIVGGVDAGEEPVAAALREIREETGYKNLKLIKHLGKREDAYFAAHKNENRVAQADVFVFDLVDDVQESVTLEDTRHHKALWKKFEEVPSFLNVEAHRYIWRQFQKEEAYGGPGVLVNSGKFDGMENEKAKKEIVKLVHGREKVQYKLRDWSVSRQRYWGAPIPMVHCPRCGIVAVPDKELPVLLPDDVDYRPHGMPPLASSATFMNVKCPQCGGEAKRDPETLDTFVDSSWYYLRYTDPKNEKEIFGKDKAKHWLPVDLYVIGAEHTVLHLLYSRFITKFLHDEGHLSFEEPFLKLRHQGLIMGPDGQKMSKSKGNVINPDDVVGEFGADTVRMYLMFMGPFEDGQPWDPKSILGVERFLKRAWNYLSEIAGRKASKESEGATKALVHKTIKKVTEDIRDFKFNTAISAFMILFNALTEGAPLDKKDAESVVKLLHPFAPHMAEELWSLFGHRETIAFEEWPKYEPKLIIEEKLTLVLQVNGKVRDTVEVAADMDEAAAKALALANAKIQAALGGAEPKRVVYVPKKLVNIVI